MQIEDSVFWVLLAFLCILLAVFPRILYFFTDLLNMRSPANLLFLFMIAMLLYKCFQMSMHISVLEERIRTLAQDQALKKLAEEERAAAEKAAVTGAAAEKTAAEKTVAEKVPEVSE